MLLQHSFLIDLKFMVKKNRGDSIPEGSGREKCSTNFGKTKNLNNFVCDYSKNPFLKESFSS